MDIRDEHPGVPAKLPSRRSSRLGGAPAAFILTLAAACTPIAAVAKTPSEKPKTVSITEQAQPVMSTASPQPRATPSPAPITSPSAIAIPAATRTPPKISGIDWEPPGQQSPIVVNVPTSYYSATFPTDRDVTFVWPKQPRWSAFNVVGGRNVRIVGGSLFKTTKTGAGIRITGTSQSIFIKDLTIDMAGSPTDALNLSGDSSAPYANQPDVYIEDSRIVNVNGAKNGNHSDVYQPQGAINHLFVNGLTASSDYQGLFLSPQDAPIAAISLSRINLFYSKGGESITPVTYLLWLLDSGTTKSMPLSDFTDVYHDPPRSSRRSAASDLSCTRSGGFFRRCSRSSQLRWMAVRVLPGTSCRRHGNQRKSARGRLRGSRESSRLTISLKKPQENV